MLFEYCSAIHIHSTYSDGTGEVPEIVDAARAAGLDVIVLTDHNTLQPRADGWEGWHDDLLLVVGEEVSGRHGHCLALGTSDQVNHRQPPGGIVKEIVNQQGLAFLAHPHGVYRPLLKTRDHSWKDWSVNSYTGLELWSYMFDWVSEFKYYRFFRHYNNPRAHIRGPFSETVRTWDRLCQKTQVVCIGGVDAHARRYPLLPFVVFPYKDLFRTVRTRLLLPEPLSGSASEDIPRILRALREGHCFISYDGLRNGEGARFASADGALLMGDASTFNGPVELHVRLPAEADITVVRDGAALLNFRGATCAFSADAPGVYRVQASLAGKPWIYTNPIYLRPPAR